MSTPESAAPRLPDSERYAEGDDPDLGVQEMVKQRTRIPEEERDVRIPDPDE